MNQIKIFFAIMLTFLFALRCSDNPTGPEVYDYTEQIILNVNSDSLMSYVAHLSGEEPVTINGQTYTIRSRHNDYPGNKIAADYIAQKLIQFGLTPSFDNYSDTGENVLASIEGNKYPDQYYIICAHYDSMPDGAVAPGADDNASGVAAVLEAARILINYKFEYTVIFALWDEEELGLIGSRNYAYEAESHNRDIKGVVNLDMISYETDGNKIVRVQLNPDGSADFIGDILEEVDSKYNLSLDPVPVHNISGSDHRSFIEAGYPAILIIEDYADDWNENYHTPQDLMTNIDVPYFQECTRLAVGTLSKLITITGNKQNNN